MINSSLTYTTKSCPLSEIDLRFSSDVVNQLPKLTWGKGGFMLDQLERRQEPREGGLWAFVTLCGPIVAGWSTIQLRASGRHSGPGEVHFFVHWNHRGKGVARNLFNLMVDKAYKSGVKEIYGRPGTEFAGFFVKQGFRKNWNGNGYLLDVNDFVEGDRAAE